MDIGMDQVEPPVWEDEEEFFEEELEDPSLWVSVVEPSLHDNRRWSLVYKQTFRRVSDNTFWEFILGGWGNRVPRV